MAFLMSSNFVGNLMAGLLGALYAYGRTKFFAILAAVAAATSGTMFFASGRLQRALAAPPRSW